VSRSVERAIRDAIEADGPITFAAFMEMSLYGPGGFYEQPRVGVEGDFVTSPHVHPVFAELLARAIRDLHGSLGRPVPFRLTEVGAGDGTLARRLLVSLEDVSVEYHAVEIGAGRVELEGLLGEDRVSAWLDPPVDVVLANELLDNLPFRVVRGGREVRVGVDRDGLVEVLTHPDEELRRLVGGDGGGETIVPVGALAFVDRLAAVLERGYALLIDYGQVGAVGGPVHGYRAHGLVADVLAMPGDADITVGVDVAIVAERARAAGLQAFPSVTQRAALRALWFERWMRDQLGRQQQQLDARDGTGAVRTWAARSRASLLIDPGALGGLRWILLASPGLAEPPWLAAARRFAD
jgi:SAM-dependent MidA family methyltransferase